MTDIGTYSAPALADLDGDGDVDALVATGSGGWAYFENTGDASGASFAASQDSPFGLQGGLSFAAPALGDVDGDGDLDLLAGTLLGSFVYQENTGSATAPAFSTSQSNPFGLADIGYFSSPTFGDADGDGDLDLLAGDDAGDLSYFENTGSASAPAFDARVLNPFGIDTAVYTGAPVFGDLDRDGDLDFVAGAANGFVDFFINTGDAQSPSFTVINENPVDFGTNAVPALGDLDGDGDLDMLVGLSTGGFDFAEHRDNVVNLSRAQRTGSDNPLNGFDIGLRSQPAIGDLDGDGDLDTITGRNSGTFVYRVNTGSALAPAFVTSSITGLTDVGSYSAPALGDLDGDGDLDMVSGEYNAPIRFFENTGTVENPAFAIRTGANNPFNGFSASRAYWVPTLGDVDGDGDLDLLANGDRDGGILYLRNNGTRTAPSFVTANLSGVSNSNYRVAPAFGDADVDGDIDVLIGQSDGGFVFRENTGSRVAPAFATAPIDGLTDVGYSAAPTFADLDGDGDHDIVVGNASGQFRYFETLRSPAPRFSVAAPPGLTDIGYLSVPAFADLDGDGDLDLLAGRGGSSSTPTFFENSGSPSIPAFASTTLPPGLDVTGDSLSFAFGDLDADGDLDTIYGSGTLDAHFYLENTGTPESPAFVSSSITGLGGEVINAQTALGDLDGDGDLDLLSGETFGNLLYFVNTGTPAVPAFTSMTLPSGLDEDLGTSSYANLVDIDGDGDLDVFAADQVSEFVFENTGTPTAPAFASSALFDGFPGAGYFQRPVFGDLDGDGDLEAVVGRDAGDFFYRVNISRSVIPRIAEGDEAPTGKRVVVAISKNESPGAFNLRLNATDDFDHELTWSIRLPAAHGVATATGTGTTKKVNYAPDNDFVGEDVFIVEVTNEVGFVDNITVVVRIFDPDNAIPLRDNFDTLDTDDDNALTLAEAQVQIPGLTQMEYDLLDIDRNGELSLIEIMEAISGVGMADLAYVNFSNVGTEDGTTPATGFNSLLEGAIFVTEGGTVVISGGSSSEAIYIPKPMTLDTDGTNVTIGQQP